MMLVSKNSLSFIDLFAIEFEIRREGPLHLTELLERPVFGPVTGHLEVAFTCDGNLDFVSLFEIESFNNHSGKTHSQTVTPFGNLHKRYTCLIVYPYELGSNLWATVGHLDGGVAPFERSHARANHLCPFLVMQRQHAIERRPQLLSPFLARIPEAAFARRRLAVVFGLPCTRQAN